MTDAAYHVADAHRRTSDEVCALLQTDRTRGLSAAEAQARFARVGPNALAEPEPVRWWRRVLEQFESPLVLLLVAAVVVSFVVWAIEGAHGVPYEAVTILVIVILNAVLGYVQEARAEAAVESLKKLTAAHAVVVRDGERQTIAATEVLPGDLLAIDEGASIPADARVVESVSLHTMEAALTGESTPVAKTVEPVAADAGVGDRFDMLFSGTAASSGHGLAVVTATGMQAEIGKIAHLLSQTESEQTPLQAELDFVGKILSAAVIAIAVIVGATLLALQQSLVPAVLVAVLLYAVSLAVAAVPEGLSAVTTVVLSLGMQRMAKRNVIVRRLAAVETLGSATVILSDKTGTLTKNEMTVRVVATASGRVDVTGTGYAPEGALHHAGAPLGDGPLRREAEWALAAGYLSSNATLERRDGAWTVVGDPTEAALEVAALKAGHDAASLERRFPRVHEVPFSSERKLMSTAHRDPERDRMLLFVKGAPDVLLARCTHERIDAHERPLDEGRRAEILATVDALAGEALRLIGMAFRQLPAGLVAELDERAEDGLTWLGMAGMIDPPRPEAIEAVRAAHGAGLRVVMITGDHPAAASAIARELGIVASGSGAGARAITGAELERMPDGELTERVQACLVYARVSPEHKLRIVRALKHHREIVAMTGDGVNDAPALRAADIGVAMGHGGTDVAKQASDMILTDDNFASIVAAIEEGRSIYANIQKFLRYLLATNLGEVLVLFFGVVLAGVLGIAAGEGEVLVVPLLATMILWINLVTDGAPALAVGVDPANPALMRRPPRNPRARVVTPRMWAGNVVAGVVMCIGTLALLDASLPGGLFEGDDNIRHARTLAFHALVFFQLFDVFCIRSDEESVWHGLFSNAWLWLAVALAVALQGLVLYVPLLQAAFGTVALSAADWALCIAVASSVVVARESLKAYFRAVDRRAAAGALLQR
ncbi:MAG: cation-translocating P-type ATPase [Burkholderiales bacterium]|nr:cation-translocating P-type ATPase [Burkholderiales bacterium]